MVFSCIENDLFIQKWSTSTTCSGDPDFVHPTVSEVQCAGGIGNYTFKDFIVAGSEHVGCQMGTSSLGDSSPTAAPGPGWIASAVIAGVMGVFAILAVAYIAILIGHGAQGADKVVAHEIELTDA